MPLLKPGVVGTVGEGVVIRGIVGRAGIALGMAGGALGAENLGVTGAENLGVLGIENLGTFGAENLGVAGVENLGVLGIEKRGETLGIGEALNPPPLMPPPPPRAAITGANDQLNAVAPARRSELAMLKT